MDKRLERILPRVQKPARYVGGEYNAVMKDLSQVDTRVAFCFPDTYEIGMSNLGMRILYGIMNNMEGVWCERVFAPWGDMEEEMRRAGLPLYALESGDPIRDFDIIAFSVGYEMAFPAILNMLDLAGVPLHASERTELTPLVIAGGTAMFNCEPIADFIDIAEIGEGEEMNAELIELHRRARREGWTKQQFLRAAAQLDGIYVPGLYEVDYNADGTVKSITPKVGAPKVVTIKTDVTKYEEVRFSILRVMQEYGQLDLMFANAGIATAGWVYNHPPQDWAWAMNTNVLGLTYYVHEVLPIFKQQGTPCHFLFTASIAGLITGLRYNTAYLASKHAAVCIAEAVRDLAENDPDYSMMGVSVFCPEYVHTNIHNSEDHRPADYSVPCDPFYATDSYWDYRRLFDSNITVKGMNPAFVGPYLFEAVEENHMYKVPHMHTHEQIRARHRRIESDLEREEALHEKYAPLQKY